MHQGTLNGIGTPRTPMNSLSPVHPTMSRTASLIVAFATAAFLLLEAGCQNDPIYPDTATTREVDRIGPPSVVGVYVMVDGKVSVRGSGFIAIENLRQAMTSTDTNPQDYDRTEHVCGVVTDGRLVEGKGTVVVEFADSREQHAVHARYTDGNRNLALLEVRYHAVVPHPSLTLSDQESQIGDPVFAVSAAEGRDAEIKEGKLSAPQRIDRNDGWQTTCPIALQGLGGPLVNEQGHLVGIVTAAQSEATTTAIAGNVVREFLLVAPKNLAGLNQWMEGLQKK